MHKHTVYSNLTQQVNKKLSHYLGNTNANKKGLLIFDHGLGDYIMFLDIFDALIKKYPKWDLYLGYYPSLALEGLHEKGYPIKEIHKHFVIPYGRSIVQFPCHGEDRYDIHDLYKKFDLIAVIQYYDYITGAGPIKLANPGTKNETCAELEIGLPDIHKDKYKIDIKLNNENSKKIGFHFNTNTDKAGKLPDFDVQEKIWNEIIDAGYEPFDMHNNPTTNIVSSRFDLPSFIPPDRSLRNETMSLKDGLMKQISECKYFIGVLSGPLLLADNILGSDKCICLEKTFSVEKYLPKEKYPMTIINFSNGYEDGTVLNQMRKLDNNETL